MNKTKQRRQLRTRNKINKVNRGLPRLSVYRTDQHIYVQAIDDKTSNTIASASTVQDKHKGKENSLDKAIRIGSLIAERLKDKKVKKIVFDRGRFPYKGRIKSLADSARKSGLEF